MRRTVQGVALVLAVAAASVTSAAAGDPQAGRALALTWCKNCHIVGPGGSGTDAVPSFPAIASDATLTPDRLRALLANPRHPMPNPQLANPEIEDLLAYIQSLKQ
jgi:mono/diheme cytochrome c family protein